MRRGRRPPGPRCRCSGGREGKSWRPGRCRSRLGRARTRQRPLPKSTPPRSSGRLQQRLPQWQCCWTPQRKACRRPQLPPPSCPQGMWRRRQSQLLQRCQAGTPRRRRWRWRRWQRWPCHWRSWCRRLTRAQLHKSPGSRGCSWRCPRPHSSRSRRSRRQWRTWTAWPGWPCPQGSRAAPQCPPCSSPQLCTACTPRTGHSRSSSCRSTRFDSVRR